MSGYIGGWLHDEEDQEFLDSLPSEMSVLAMRGTYNEVRVDARKVMKIEIRGPLDHAKDTL
jgi:hypothetical protein